MVICTMLLQPRKARSPTAVTEGKMVTEVSVLQFKKASNPMAPLLPPST
jgi:hypothetical protein